MTQRDEIKCEKCGYSEFEYDKSWKEYSCKKCGWIAGNNNTIVLNKKMETAVGQEKVIEYNITDDIPKDNNFNARLAENIEQENHTCENCKKKGPGRNFLFYCAKKDGVYKDHKTKRTSYEIIDQINPFICNKCLERGFITRRLYYGFFFVCYSVAIIGLSFLFSKGFGFWNSANELNSLHHPRLNIAIEIIGFCLSVIPWLFLKKVSDDQSAIASSLVKRNHKKLIPQTIEEHKRSWDIILTPSEYKELDKYHTYEPDNEKILIGLFIFIIALILLLIIGINRS